MLRTAKIHDRVASFSDRPHATRANLRFPVSARNIEDVGRLTEARDTAAQGCHQSLPLGDRKCGNGWCRARGPGGGGNRA